MTKLIVGNWKMNGNFKENEILLTEIKKGLENFKNPCEIAAAVPFVYLSQIQNLIKNSSINLAVQDLSSHEKGAFTGDISALMLKDFDVKYVLVGHSERRLYHGETNEIIAEKTRIALKNNLIPIVCLGETLQEREAGKVEEIIKNQLSVVLEKIKAEEKEKINSVIVAYEPVWAIGTGKTASPNEAQEIHKFIRQELKNFTNENKKNRLLYGGSMNSKNAKELLSQEDIDGGLIGGASLKSEDFLQIINSAK